MNKSVLMSTVTSDPEAIGSAGLVDIKSTSPASENTETPYPEDHDMNEMEDDALEEVDESTMSLPLSKIKRIFKIDPDYFGSSASAVYATGVATELFVQYLAEHASVLAKLEKRKKIQYKDLSNAVSTQDALHFLSDTIPRTQTVGLAIKEKKINLSESDKSKHADIVGEEQVENEEASSGRPTLPPLPKGQTSLPFEPVPKSEVKKAVIHDLVLNDNAQNESDSMTIDG